MITLFTRVYRAHHRLVQILTLSMLFFACGDSSDFDTSVTEISLRDRTTIVGERASIRVHLELGSYPTLGVNGEDDRVSTFFALTVFLPPGLRYEPGTSKVTDSLFGDTLFGNPDPRSPNRTGTCDTGESYVYYEFREGEFDDPTSLDAASVIVKLEATAEAAAHNGVLSAGAQSYPAGDPCYASKQRSSIILVSAR